jgi:hypothetical protein
MKKHSYESVKEYFNIMGCELLSENYCNNVTKMKFRCRCGNVSYIRFNQFKKTPQCNQCGLLQMKKTKNKGEKKCRVCGVLLTSTNKQQSANSTFGNICHLCFNKKYADYQRVNGKKYYIKHHVRRIEYFRNRRKENPEVIQEQGRRCFQKLKTEVLKHYSDDLSCRRCGFNQHMAALSIDHINGGGTKHRKQISGGNLYRWLKNNKYPEGFQVLCMSCQCIKRFENNECKNTKNTTKYYHKLRLDVLRKYSPNLSCKCGVSHIAALSVDHINGDGNQHRKEVGNCVYHWLKKNNYPDGFQVLCMSCQYIKRWENNEFKKVGPVH